jgi:hypothetical protein
MGIGDRSLSLFVYYSPCEDLLCANGYSQNCEQEKYYRTTVNPAGYKESESVLFHNCL